ncbi:MAG: translocation/assembly module TamB domain-containing protein, partial [Crocinitomicaceae bacterium]|nr:translocation/assembly module TamB domain-containing protein [Crocinitomicaceae bacterium]
MKRLLKILRNTLIAFFLLITAAYFAFQYPPVQTWAAGIAARYLSSELGTEVSVGKVEIDLWSRFVLGEVLIKDQKKDTLVYLPEARLREFSVNKKNGDVKISNLTLDRPYFNLVKYEGDTVLNYQFILNYIRQFSDSTDTSSTSNVFLKNLSIIDGRLNYCNMKLPERGVFGLDWNRLHLTGVHLDLEDLSAVGDSIHANISQLAGADISGLELKEFRSELTIRQGEVALTRSHIQTAASELNGDLIFFIESIEDLDDFENRVKMDHRFDNSVLEMGDLAFFSSDLHGWKKSIEFSGNVKGRIAHLKGRDIRIKFDDYSHFHGNFSMDGLPEIDQTFITLDIKELSSNKRELDRIQLPPFDSLHYLQTPANIATLGQWGFSGNFTGFINDFVANGKLTTAIGEITSDLALRKDSAANDYLYSGNLGTKQFDLGRFYNKQMLGPITSSLTLKGKGIALDKVDAEFQGTIPNIEVNGYNYCNIKADGTFRQRFFDGNIRVDDPNLVMAFDGKIDFTKARPELNFESEIDWLDLRATKLLTDFDYSTVSGNITVNSSGFDFQRFTGTIEVEDLSYCTLTKEFFVEKIQLKSERKDGMIVTLSSDIADATLKGDFDLATLQSSFEKILTHIIPKYNPPLEKHKPQNFTLDFLIKDFSDISEIFIPELKVASQTRLNMVVNEAESFFEINLVSDSVSYSDNRIESFTLDARRPDESLYLTLSSDRLKIGKELVFESFAIDTRSDADTIYSSVAWGDTTASHWGDMNGKIVVRGYENFNYTVENSKLIINDEKWNFRPGGEVKMDSSHFEFSGLRLENNMQSIDFSGDIDKDPSKNLCITMDAIDLTNVNPFIGNKIQFYGIAEGTAEISGLYGDVIVTSDIEISDLKMNEYLIGMVGVKSTWDNMKKRMRLDGKVIRQDIPLLSFAGYYTPAQKENSLDIVATFTRLDLAFINEFLAEGIMKINGYASGTMSVKGTPENPLLKSVAALDGANIYVNYLNTTYYIEEQVGVEPDMFVFNHVRIKDQEGNKGYLTGTILHNAFAEWNFDVYAEMDDPMLVMNTTSEMNSIYYGKAYSTGYVNISGYDDQLEFDIGLKSEKGTRLSMPMNASEEVTFENFIRFVDARSEKKEEPNNFMGIKLNMKFDITPDAKFEIIFDEAVGDVMTGSGRGSITMEINNLSTFNMYGQVELMKGDYLFTLKNLLNKEFTVKPGGTISWYGDPFGAELNLETVYKVSASLQNILPDQTANSGQRVPVDLVMKLTGKMFDPAIDFEIELPSVDQVTRSRVES